MTRFFISGMLALTSMLPLNAPLAHASPSVYFDIPSMVLEDALLLFAKQANVEIVFDPKNPTFSKRSPRVKGESEIKTVLQKLLRNMDLTFSQLDDDVFVVHKPLRKRRLASRSPYKQERDIAEVLVIGDRYDKKNERSFLKNAAFQTGMGKPKSIFEASVAGSYLTEEDIRRISTANSAGVLRYVPGLRVEDTAGEGNSNISVRGLPALIGGAQYIQFLEDGAPILLFGDTGFATPDTFLRVDTSISRIESIRAGTAATMAVNAPGGIINFISKTGEHEGGSIKLSQGLDIDRQRLDLEFGNKISDNWRFFVGGFYRTSRGLRNVDYRTENGFQFKFNTTYETKLGKIEYHFRRLKDKALAILPTAVDPKGNGLDGYSSFDLTQSRYLQTSSYINEAGELATSDIRDGQAPNLSSQLFKFRYDLSEVWSITQSVRHSAIDGHWVGTTFTDSFSSDVHIFPYSPNDDGTVPLIQGRARYANGPNVGSLYEGTVHEIKVFDTTINDLGSVHATTALSANLSENLSLTIGSFYGEQKIDTLWHWSTYLAESKGDNAALIDLIDDQGAAITENGLAHYGVNWGPCCTRRENFDHEVASGFVQVDSRYKDVLFDLSLRKDYRQAAGYAYGGTKRNVGDINRDGRISPVEVNALVPDPSKKRFVSRDFNTTSTSGGLTYLYHEKLSFYARYSNGIYDGSNRRLADIAIGFLNENTPLSDDLRLGDIGIKYSAEDFDLSVSLFDSLVDVRYLSGEFSLLKENLTFGARGAEVEAKWQKNAFIVDGSMTFTDAEILDHNNPEVIGNVPRRQARYVYNASAHYLSASFETGISVFGTSRSYTDNFNDIEHDAYALWTFFVSYLPSDNTNISLNVYNLFNDVGVTETGANLSYRTTGNRQTTLSLGYSF